MPSQVCSIRPPLVHCCVAVRRLALIILAGLGFACAEAQTVFIERPTLAGAQTEILAVHGPNGVDLFVVDLASAEDTPVRGQHTVARGERVEFEALMFTETASELGLRPGPLPPTSEALGGQPIPEPEAQFILEIDDSGVVEAWKRAMSISAAVAAVRVQREVVGAQCPSFTQMVKSLGVDEHVDFIAPTSDGAIISAGGVHRFFVGDTLELERIDGPATATVTGGGFAVLAEDEFVLSEGRGVFYHARWHEHRLTFEVLPDSDRGTGGDRFGAGRRQGEIEIFDVSASGYFAHYRGSWDRITKLSEGREGITAYNRRGAVWLGPGQALLAWPQDLHLWHYRNQLLEEVPTPSMDTFTAIEKIDGLGFVAGTTSGGLMIGNVGDWTMYPGDSGLAVTRIAPFRDGVAFGGEVGTFGVYLPATGICPMIIGHLAQGLQTLPGGTIVVGGSNGTVTFLIPD